MMKNLKKLDDKEVIFLDQLWTKEEQERFSAMLKSRKVKTELKKTRRNKHRQKRKLA